VPWDPGQVLGEAWDIVKLHWPVLIFAPLVVGLLVGVPSWILNQIHFDGAAGVLVWFGSVALQVVLGAFFEGGLARLLVTAARREVPEFGTIFQGGGVFARMLGVNFLLGLLSWMLVGVTMAPAGVLAAQEIGLDAFTKQELLFSRLTQLTSTPLLAFLAGMLVLLPLSVFLTMRLTFAHYYVVDTERGPIEALGASWRAMQGQMLTLFGFGVLAFLLTVAGLMLCCVGIFPVMAVTKVAEAIIYTRISGRMGAARPY
jgi:hypothetical protein